MDHFVEKSIRFIINKYESLHFQDELDFYTKTEERKIKMNKRHIFFCVLLHSQVNKFDSFAWLGLPWLDCCVYINIVMHLEAQINKISLNATIMTIQYIKWSQAMQSNKQNEDEKDAVEYDGKSQPERTK